MDTAHLRALVKAYSPGDAPQQEAKSRTLRFLASTAGVPWSRKNFDDGHVTASAWVIDAAGAHGLLFHHRKLGRWLQIGGHIEEGDADFFVALEREVQEETGLGQIKYRRELFDIDAHAYPARGDEPEHIHYDLRVLVWAVVATNISVQLEEARELRWVALTEVANYGVGESVLRLARKSLQLTADR